MPRRQASGCVGRLEVVDVRVSGFLLVPVVALAKRVPDADARRPT
jgi:hypothetical protein